jgi:MFS family permease
MTGSTPEVRVYRWVICACSFLVLFVSQGMTLGGMAVFDIQLINSISAATGNEVSVSDIKWRDTIMFLAAAVSGLGSGWLADKVGVKPLILVGLAMLAMGNLLYGRVEQLTDAYWISAGLGVVLALCGLMINVYLISSWFDKYRGLAIGIVLAGTSLGNAFFPKLNTWMISTADWRQAFEWLAWIPLILLPIAFFLLKNGPMSAGKQDVAKDAGAPRELPGYTLGKALRSRNFWMLAIIAMCTFYSILGMTTNVFIYMSKSAYPPQVASTGVSILFIGGLVGKLISGYMAENFGRKRILLIGLVLMLFGGICLLVAISKTSDTALWAGLIFFGFGWGGIYTLIQLLSPDLFGMRSLGKILAAINILDAAGGAAGPIVTGMLYGSSGSYFLPFAVITGLLLIATIAASLLDMSKAEFLNNLSGKAPAASGVSA